MRNKSHDPQLDKDLRHLIAKVGQEYMLRIPGILQNSCDRYRDETIQSPFISDSHPASTIRSNDCIVTTNWKALSEHIGVAARFAINCTSVSAS